MYPRELNLDADTEERLVSFLETELLNHYAERSTYMDRLSQWQRDYWAEPTTKQAKFPFVGASTIVVPLTAIAVEAVHARTMTTLFAINQFVATTPVSKIWAEAARPVERFLNKEMLQEMQIRKKLGSAILELEKFGTGIAKVGYEKIVKYAVQTLPDGSEIETPVTIRDGAVVDAVSNGRFLMPFHEQDPQSALWCGEEHSASPFVVKTHEESGFFKSGTMKKLESWISERTNSTTGVERKFKTQQENLEGRKPTWPKDLDWAEVWLAFNIDDDPDGRTKEIVVHYHRGARAIMSVRHNWHDDLHRPYRTGVYFPLEHRWQGMGICKQNEQFQRSITTQNRQRLDNGTLANMRMIKVSKLSGYGPDEPIFPGKMWFLDDMSHVDTMQLGELYNSAYSNEQVTMQYYERRLGVNDTILGIPAAGTPGTATGDLARIQESNKRFDFVYQNIKEFSREIVVDTAVIIQQFGPRRIEYYETAENGNLVAEFFEMPSEYIRHGLLIELAAAGQQQNKIIDRQNWVSVAQLLQQYYTGAMQLAQMLQNPQLMQHIAYKGIAASTEAMRQILESFEIRNIDRITLSEIGEALNNASHRDSPPLPVGGGEGGSAGPGQIPGMDQFAQIVQMLGAGGGQGDGRLLGPGSGV